MKRSIGAVLWSLAVWTVVGTFVAFAGWPAPIAPAAALLVGAIVWADPGGRLWQASGDAAVRRRRLADLERVTDAPARSDSQREAEPAEG